MNDNIKVYRIDDILDCLVGSTSVACETNHDNESMLNLDNLKVVLNWCIERLCNNAQYYNDYRESASKIANKSLSIIKTANETLQNKIDIKKEIDERSSNE